MYYGYLVQRDPQSEQQRPEAKASYLNRFGAFVAKLRLALGWH